MYNRRNEINTNHKRFDWDDFVYKCLVALTISFPIILVLLVLFGCGWLMWVITQLVNKL